MEVLLKSGRHTCVKGVRREKQAMLAPKTRVHRPATTGRPAAQYRQDRTKTPMATPPRSLTAQLAGGSRGAANLHIEVAANLVGRGMADDVDPGGAP